LSSTYVDGKQSWLQQMQKALQDVAVSEHFTDEHRQAIDVLLSKLLTQNSEQAQANGHTFHHKFLPARGRSLLWNSAGYSAIWFPRLAHEGGAEQLIAILKSCIRPARTQ
jgi:hypothetical protein